MSFYSFSCELHEGLVPTDIDDTFLCVGIQTS